MCVCECVIRKNFYINKGIREIPVWSRFSIMFLSWPCQLLLSFSQNFGTCFRVVQNIPFGANKDRGTLSGNAKWSCQTLAYIALQFQQNGWGQYKAVLFLNNSWKTFVLLYITFVSYNSIAMTSSQSFHRPFFPKIRWCIIIVNLSLRNSLILFSGSSFRCFTS